MGLEMELDNAQIRKLGTLALIAAELGHSLVTVQTGILGSTEILEKYLKEGNVELVEKYAKQIGDFSMFSGEIIRGVHNYVSSGGKVESDPYSLGDLVEAFARRGRAMFGNVKTDNSYYVPEITLQEDLLKICLYNLFRNARGATASMIECSTEAVEGFVKISVTDNGVGMMPERLEEILKKLEDPIGSFLRGERGLGLLTTKHIMDLCSGRLEIESEYGKGTTVSMYIPAVKEKD